ncbi:Zn-ribbon domain-containing OB-fold protein [Mycobacterium branderi]|uniref:ChsH2 C-terminal OB-fold domain-containing protein n=1 Tax=Mycobacterium branderi TaxID=43348 RepID=A0A7I7WDG0_9MYCO|nr:OB-fold domain-containing protein [Mycobacterium branderi]MCV7231768.1 OB-fold domain-containing protein [Mycobacterium branderi]ORA40270.1 hypothetical protein BST20_06865 [Mycobacterium branderi]BBZ15579.1 hypothetical protein MBRA_57740 [Mycobacterium branderi]
MTDIVAIGTYLPPWEQGGRRVKGPDEDALTMAVAAGRAADPGATASAVVMVSRNFPLLEGGNAAVLLAGLSLPADVPVSEVLGGAPAVLDQILAGAEGTLVIAADDSDSAAGGAAVLIGAGGGAKLSPAARQSRSLPTVTRHDDGSRQRYVDPRLQREVGLKSTLKRLGLTGTPVVAAVAGVKRSQMGNDFDVTDTADDPAVSATAVIRLIAAAIENGRAGLVLAIEQSSISVAELSTGGHRPGVTRDEAAPTELPKLQVSEGVGIPISLPAYARAFEPKLRWEAAVFDERPGIDTAPLFPPRARVDSGGALADQYRLAPLPRTGTVYTHTTVRIPVPDLPSPYSLALVQLDDSPVRALLKVTGVPPGTTAVGQAGTVVLRRIAIRSGIPDYGYMFWPGKPAAAQPEGAPA